MPRSHARPDHGAANVAGGDAEQRRRKRRAPAPRPHGAVRPVFETSAGDVAGGDVMWTKEEAFARRGLTELCGRLEASADDLTHHHVRTRQA